MTAPVVSVVLPVYNCPRLVGQAIESILGQSWRDHEVIIINDGSTDETLSVLERYNDPRIQLINQTNRGLAATLNRGIGMARGRYIARQDQDDISYSERLAKQVAYLDANEKCALVGTWAEIWRESTKTGMQHMHAAANARLKFELLLNNPFVHSSVMIRKSALDRIGGYSVDRARQPPEDYELWSRLARDYEVANIPEVLHVYREIQGSMSRDGLSPFMERLVMISAENIAYAAGLSPSNPHVVNIACLVHGALHRIQGKPDIREMGKVFRRAAEGVVPEEERRSFSLEAIRRIESLRYSHPEMFHSTLVGRKLPRLARRMSTLLKRWC